MKMNIWVGTHYPDRSREESLSVSVSLCSEKVALIRPDTCLYLKSRNEQQRGHLQHPLSTQQHTHIQHHREALPNLLYSKKKKKNPLLGLTLKEILWFPCDVTKGQA